MSFPIGFADFAGMALSLSNGFHSFAQWAAPAAVAGLWQGAAVAAGLAICLRLAPRVSATHRFVAWMAGFGVAAGLPALPFALRTLFASGAVQGDAAAGPQAWLELDARWSLAIAGLWLGLSAYRVVRLAIHSLRLHRLWKTAEPIQDDAIISIASGLLLSRGQARGVEICSTRELDRPSVIGFFAPRILIPEWLLERLTHEELEQVILHESEHLRRGDDWTNLAQKLCLAAFPVNAALVWMDRRLSKEREMACDEGVVRVTGAPRAYAACLASLAERSLEKRVARDFGRRAEALSLGAFERRPELVHRVHSILGGKMLSPVAGRALVGVVGCGLLFGSVELARCPQAVAFIEEPSTAAMASTAGPAKMADRARADYVVARGNEGFRAVNAMAMIPARPFQASLGRTHEDRSATTQTRMENRSEAPAAKMAAANAPAAHAREVLLKSRVPAPAAKQPQEWLVVTTWRVQTTYTAQNVADYDDAPAAGQAATVDASTADARPQNQATKTAPIANMAVTRMFLGVYRARQTAQAAQGQSAVKKTVGNTPAATDAELKSLANQPAARTLSAVPVGDGWLVIQL